MTIFTFLWMSAHASVCQEQLFKQQLHSVLLDNYEIQKISVNSSSDDRGAFFYKDTLFFSSNRRTRRVKQLIHKEDLSYVFNLYTATKKKRKRYSIAFLKGDVNTKLNQSLPVITKDGSTMYFTGNTSKGAEIQRGLRILKATKKNGYWTDVTDISINSDAYSNAHAVLNADETEMYFVSDREGKPGDSDIYKVRIYADGGFGTPTRLGNNINTFREEITPFVTADNALYFASKGHPGLGGFDVFYVDLNDEMAVPINIGSVINTASDDFGFSINVKTAQGFMSSNKNATIDLYTVKEKNPIRKLLAELKTKRLQESKLKKERARTVRISPIYEADIETSSNELKASSSFPKDAKNQITSFIDSLFHKRASSKVRKPSNVVKSSVSKLNPRTAITPKKSLQNTKTHVIDYFNHNSSYLHTAFKNRLTALAQKLKEDRALQVQFYVHADARGTTDYNMMLTKKRLKRIQTYLIHIGVYPSQVTGQAYGESLILNKCLDGVICEETSHKINRRVTYKWIRK